MTCFLTFRDWFLQFWITLCSWPVGFPHCSAIARKNLSSVTKCLLLYDGDPCRALWNDTLSIFRGAVILCFQKTSVSYIKKTRGTLFFISMSLHVLYYWHFQATIHKSASDSDTCFVGPTKYIKGVCAVRKFLSQWQAIHGRGLYDGTLNDSWNWG